MALNLANTVTITAKTALVNVTTVSANVLSNASSSGQIHKINTLMFNNYCNYCLIVVCLNKSK